ncbi:peroxiredoxin 5, prdx5 [Drechmeria coniospora]|uniref:Peroxiredoxin 5, prdx5 n=1 Tax=Drechmeria coniospora TaxID=98403 RepID=A0A151GCM4_DRECN|nr:peroxiredoxin 5, prdx5 [Drechmeria coniospora]KYK54795.1 peroxiredoxin 5, prdx5 [Drechmeria coniospora]
MAFRASLRPVARALPGAVRSLHSTPRALVKAGDGLPDFGGLYENSPGNQINLAKEFQSSDGYIIGVPGAFTGTCSSKHVPSYMNHPNLDKAGQVFVVSVNDPFVLGASNWTLPARRVQVQPLLPCLAIVDGVQIRFLADPTAEFTKALDLGFDAPIFGHTRSQRYALKVENGKITKTHIEPDATGADVSMADKVLGS